MQRLTAMIDVMCIYSSYAATQANLEVGNNDEAFDSITQGVKIFGFAEPITRNFELRRSPNLCDSVLHNPPNHKYSTFAGPADRLYRQTVTHPLRKLGARSKAAERAAFVFANGIKPTTTEIGRIAAELNMGDNGNFRDSAAESWRSDSLA